VDEESRPVAVAAPTKWHPAWTVLMMPTFLFMFLGTIMAFEMLHSTWGYQQNTQPTTPLVNFFAETFGAKDAAK
jgi:hypothetical protein